MEASAGEPVRPQRFSDVTCGSAPAAAGTAVGPGWYASAVRVELGERITAIDGVVESESAFKDDLAYWVNGTEVAHFESDRRLDIRLTRAVIRQRRPQLRADPRIRLRSSSSDWVAVELDGPDVTELVTQLVGWAAAAHRAPPGTSAKPPPSAPDLGRRRRFH
jgi:hypothetical protein